MSMYGRFSSLRPGQEVGGDVRHTESGGSVSVGGVSDILPGDISASAEAYDTRPEAYRVSGDFTHVSTLISGCSRMSCLAVKYPDITATKSVAKGTRVLWAMGRSLERHFRKSMVAMYPNESYGLWSCRCGKTVQEGVYAEVDRFTCGTCATHLHEYKEYVVFDNDLQVSGSIDFLLKVGDSFRVVECKSTNRKGLEKAKKAGAPTDYMLQPLMYRRLLSREGKRVHNEVTLIYVAKDSVPYHPSYHECTFSEDTKAGLRVALDLMEEKAAKIASFRGGGGTLPGRLGECRSVSSTGAKGCPFAGVCFDRSNE